MNACYTKHSRDKHKKSSVFTKKIEFGREETGKKTIKTNNEIDWTKNENSGNQKIENKLDQRTKSY